MNLKSSFLLAVRMILPKTRSSSNARRSMLGAVLCIALSLIPLVVVLVVSESMINGITDRIIGLSSYHIQATQYTAYKGNENVEEFEEFIAQVRQIDGVKCAYHERQGIALAAGKKGRTGATIRAVDPDVFVADTAFKKYVSLHAGTSDISSSHSALIGTKMAETLDLGPGDKFRLITAKSNAAGKIIPRVTTFTVSGVISCGYQEIDALWIFIPYNTGYSLMSNEASQVICGIETEIPFSPKFHEVYKKIGDILPNGVEIFKWSDMNSSEFENFASTKMLLLLIMCLIVLVASINMSSALVMLVKERRREIAILKSIGESNSGITLSFIMIGFAIGLAGVLAGIPLGLLISLNINGLISGLEKLLNFFRQAGYQLINRGDFSAIHILDPAYYLETIPVTIPVKEILFIMLITLVLCLLVSIIPAVKAGKEKPLSILRKV